MQYIQEITLDLYQPNYVYVYAKQGDADARFLRIHLTANGVEFKPDTGVSAAFRALKRDGKSIDNPAVIDADGTILACLTDQTLAVAGEVTADIVLKKGTEVISTLNFVIVVQPAPQGADLPSTHELGEMNQATADAVAAAKSANTAAGKANTAAQGANTATEAANEAAALLEGMTVTVSDVEPGGKATAALTKQDDHYNLALGLVKGDTGPVSSVNGGTGDVVIGVRNLLRRTESPLVAVGNGSSNQLVNFYRLSEAVTLTEEKKKYHISFDYEASSGASGSFNVVFSARGSYEWITSVVDVSQKPNGHVANYIETEITNEDRAFFLRFVSVTGSITIRNARVVIGSVDVDWMPAPEDKANAIQQFDIKLPASGWANGSQTVTDTRFLDGAQYDYDVNVKGACIPWNGITITKGQMVAKADIVPTTDMTWTATRREVRRDE